MFHIIQIFQVEKYLKIAFRKFKVISIKVLGCKMVDFEGVAKKAGSSILANTVAAGACLALLGAPFDLFENVLKSTFNQVGEKRLAQNVQAAQYGYTAAEDETFKCPGPGR